MSPRKRTKMARFDEKRMKALRAEMLKCPNPMFSEMVRDDRASDGDLMDFAITLAHSYFSGALLEPVTAAAGRELERMTRRVLLETAALFGATATFEKDGAAVVKAVFPEDAPDRLTFAVQQLVDTGLSVAESMQRLEPPAPAQCQMESDIHTQLPARVH